ncbi:MAG TPA: amino acid deaminase/aldolase [Candidatus Hydrogenedentes bacterium]|nr:amino acid deaminase/aldolase [Candidatus Hydrogenedentota bacterium]HQH50802.1 amino acid deaminase/aldolase [Candidatus Hydrogenedentota bacterium]
MKRFVREYDYYRNIFRERPLPLAYVDLELFDANIAAVLERAGRTRIRVASKSIRCVPLLERILASDERFDGVMCYTAGEAVFLSQLGLNNLLIAYPAWQEAELASLCRELRRGKRLICTIDSVEHADHLNQSGRAFDTQIPVCIDADMSYSFFGLHFGVQRSPIRDAASAAHVAKHVIGCRHLRLEGLMAYEAQIAGIPDDVPGRLFRNSAVRFLQSLSRRDVLRRRRELASAIVKAAHELAFVNGGGSGSIDFTVSDGAVTEITVGSAFFAPALFDGYHNVQYQPAAGFALEITRIPKPGVFTCLGGGYAASGSAGPDRLPSPYLPRGARLLPSEGAGEVQTPVRYRGEPRLDIGDPILMRHAKAGELCEHFNSLALVSNGAIIDEAPTYRGEGQAFL